ncbi:MAG: 6-phosphogluconolactonase [Bacteroidota bacterium]
MLDIRHADTPAAALRDAAGALADALETALADRPRASLVACGGDTARRLLPQLAAQDLDWSRITGTLADERWVDVTSPASNEALVRSLLPSAMALVGLKTGHTRAAEAGTEVARRLATLPMPFDAVFLGMGDDGHVASLFPGGPELSATTPVVASVAPRDPPERISMSFPTLFASRRIVLCILGKAKARVFERALAGDTRLPVARVLTQGVVPVHAVVCAHAP